MYLCKGVHGVVVRDQMHAVEFVESPLDIPLIHAPLAEHLHSQPLLQLHPIVSARRRRLLLALLPRLSDKVGTHLERTNLYLAVGVL